MPDSILDIKNMSIGYELKTLKCINLSISKPTIVLLLGNNGTGKSTFLKTLNKQIKPLLGSFYCNSSTASVMNFPIEAEYITIFEYLNLINKISEKEIGILLDKIGLNKNPFTYIRNMSDGEKQRLQIARAIHQNASLILLDEPTAFIDITGKKEIFTLLKNLNVTLKKSFIIATHDIHFALNIADTIWNIENNCIIEYEVPIYKNKLIE